MTMNRSSAKTLADHYDSCDWVYETTVVSERAVLIIQKHESNDNVQTFKAAADYGWRLGVRVPKETGDTMLLVPMECVGDE